MAITQQIKVTTTGGAGVATGTGRLGIEPARLAGIQIDYTGVPATTDVTIKSVLAGVEKTLLTRTDTATDFPLAQITEPLKSNVGADLADTTKSPNVALPIVAGELTVDVAQADAATDGVKVTFLLEPL